MTSRIEINRAAVLGDLPHGFLGRTGGVSDGIYASLNVGIGSDDDREAVMENRRRAMAAVAPGAELVTLHQVHSAIAVKVTHAFDVDARPHADAMVTDRPGLALGILTADCTPVLFADVAAGVIGAAHAGWKGAIGGVLDATVAAMEALGAQRERMVAAIGPTILRTSYEVDEAFMRRFMEADPQNERFFSDGRTDHAWFDLEGYNAARLAAAGIGRVETLGLDTYALADRFFSFRRTTHRRERDYGRQISLIALPD